MTEEPMTVVPLPTEQNPYRDVTYIARVTCFRPATVRGWLRDGRLKGFKIADDWRVRESDLTEFLQREYGDGS